MDQVYHGDHNPPWWTKSVQDQLGPRSDMFLMLLPKGFIAKVNNRAAVSLRGLNPNTVAQSDAPNFDACTRRLNQSFPVRNNPWLTFTQGPTGVQLAIHSIPTHILPDDDEQLFTFLKNSILNTNAVEIGAAQAPYPAPSCWARQAGHFGCRLH